MKDADVDALHMLAGDLNGVPATAERVARHRALVSETNRLISEAADSFITLDSTPLSFAAFKSGADDER
jgi:hypothetical protein